MLSWTGVYYLWCRAIIPSSKARCSKQIKLYIVIGTILFLSVWLFLLSRGWKWKKHYTLHMNLFDLLLVMYIQGFFFFLVDKLDLFPWATDRRICWHILTSYFYFVRVLFGNCEFTMGLTYWGQKPGVSQAEYPERLLLMPAVGTLGDIL